MEFIMMVLVSGFTMSAVVAIWAVTRSRKTTKVETLASLIAECEACAIAHAAAVAAVQARLGKDSAELSELKAAIGKLKS